MVEKKAINFSVSPYCTLLFSRKENIKLSEVAFSEVLPDKLHYDSERMLALKYYQYYSRYLLACEKTTMKAMKQNAKFVQTY